MQMAQAAEESGRGLPTLLLGVLGPPIIWAIRIGASYVLVPYACALRIPLMLHLVTLAALLATVGTGWMASKRWRAAPARVEGSPGGEPSRDRFLGLFGVLSSAFFFLVMVAEGLANVYLDPCQTAGAPIL